MAKLIKTQPEYLLNLQSGDFAHFTEEGIVINDVKTIEPRHFVNKIDKTRNVKKLRIALNVVASVAILVAALYSGFYPISLLLFLMLYDLRSLQRNSLPLNLSDYIPYKNITDIRMVKGKLGLNYAHIFITDDAGKKSMKKLKLYDSQSSWERSKVLFNYIGKLTDEEEVVRKTDHLEKITVGNGVEYAIDGDQLITIENGKFKPEREDPFKYFRFIAVVGLIGVLGAIIAKIQIMVQQHHYDVIDFCVLLLFALLSVIPYRFIQKSRPTILEKSKIIDFKITGSKFIIRYAGWKNFPLVVKHNLKYMTTENQERLKNYLKK